MTLAGHFGKLHSGNCITFSSNVSSVLSDSSSASTSIDACFLFLVNTAEILGCIAYDEDDDDDDEDDVDDDDDM